MSISVLTLNQLVKGKPSKKIWNFPYFSGVVGFEKVIFHKNKKHGLKMPKNCLYIESKGTYFFQ